jgi:hypothetical protein
MKSLPYFHWYPADAETDENFSAMSDAEVGFLLRCLNHSWVNGGLPIDMNELARVRKVRRSYLDKMWVRVGKCFETSEKHPGRLINPRQEKERAAAISKSLSASESAKVRYERSANAERPQEERSPNAPLRASESVYVASSPSQLEQKNGVVLVTPSKARWEVDDQFAAFVSAWREAQPNCLPSEFEDAYRPFLALAFEQRVSAVRGITQRLRTGYWKSGGPVEWRMCGKPVKYLQGEWKRVIPDVVQIPRKLSKTETLMSEMFEEAEEEDRRRAQANRSTGN